MTCKNVAKIRALELKVELQQQDIKSIEGECSELLAFGGELSDQLKRLQGCLQERFEWVLGDVNQDLKVEHEKSLELVKRSPVESQLIRDSRTIREATETVAEVVQERQMNTVATLGASAFYIELLDMSNRLMAQARSIKSASTNTTPV